MWIFLANTLQIVEVNEAAISQYGYSREEFVGLTLKDLRPPEELPFLSDCISNSNPRKKNVWETRHLDKNGKAFYVKVYSSPFDYNGLSCWLTIVQNMQEALDFKQEIADKAYKLQQVMDNSVDVICAFDKDGRFIECNQASIQVWGYKPEELIGRLFMDLVTEEDHEATIEAGKMVISGKNLTNFQNRYKKKDGSLIPVVWSARWDPKNRMLFCIAKDATEKVEAENQIKKQSERVKEILESITDSFYAVDSDWNVTYWNCEAEKVLGMPREKIINRNLWDVYQDAIPLKFYCEFHRAMNDQVSVHFEEYFPPLQIWIDVYAYPSQNGLSVFFRDITERKNTQKQIEESKERYDLLASATNDILWDWDLEKDHFHWSKAFGILLGYETTEGRTSSSWVFENVHPDDREHIKDSVYKATEKLGKWEKEYRFKCADGSYKYFADRAFVMEDKQGKVVRMIGSMRDITPLKLKQKEIEARNLKILEIAHSNSHLVRKPLANILGIIDLLAEKGDNELLDMLKNSAHELDHILKDVAEKTSRWDDLTNI